MTEYDLLVAEEELIADAQVYLHELLKARNLSKAELAELLGVSKAAISQLFSPDAPNLSLRKLARVAAALGTRVSVGDRQLIDTNASLKRKSSGRHESWMVEEHRPAFAMPVPSNANDNAGQDWARREAARSYQEIAMKRPAQVKRRLTAA